MACFFFSSAVHLLWLTSNLLFDTYPSADSEQPKRQLSLLCWADVIPKQPEGGAFAIRSAEDKQGAVFVDLKTLSAPSSSSSSSSALVVEPPLLLSPFLSRQGALPPLRVVDVRTLGKAGRVASATRVVVRQERFLLPSSAAKGKGGEGGEGGRGACASISSEALSVVLANALVEVGAAVLPAGAASFLFPAELGPSSSSSSHLPSALCLLRVVGAEPEGSGAPLRVVRSTRIELL